MRKSNLTYRGDPALKEEAIKRAIEHREADHFYHGLYANLELDGELVRIERYMRSAEATYEETVRNPQARFLGCAVGCLAFPANGRPLRRRLSWARLRRLQGTPHQELRRELGIPVALGLVADGIFESHEDADQHARGAAAKWPERFVRMIPVGLEMTPDLEDELDALRDDDDLTVEQKKRRLRRVLLHHARLQGLPEAA